jgi:hypothetical protein
MPSLLIFVAGLFAMALAGSWSREPRGAAVAQRGDASYITTSNQRAAPPLRAHLRHSHE